MKRRAFLQFLGLAPVAPAVAKIAEKLPESKVVKDVMVAAPEWDGTTTSVSMLYETSPAWGEHAAKLWAEEINKEFSENSVLSGLLKKGS